MRRLLMIAVTLLCSALAAEAIDHKNLDEGRPLRIQDAYPVAAGELAVEAGAGFVLQRRSPNRGVLDIELLYGALPNLQVGVGTRLSTSPRAIDEPEKSGDLGLNALYNFNQETLMLPAFAVKGAVHLPTGVESSGAGGELTGIVTRSIDRLSLHLNAGYEIVGGARREERDGRYRIVLGASYPVGAPRYTRTTVVGDVFTEQSVRRGDRNVVGVEIGFRHQLTPRIVWDAGLGTELTGPADRSPLFFTTGLSIGF